MVFSKLPVRQSIAEEIDRELQPLPKIIADVQFVMRRLAYFNTLCFGSKYKYKILRFRLSFFKIWTIMRLEKPSTQVPHNVPRDMGANRFDENEGYPSDFWRF